MDERIVWPEGSLSVCRTDDKEFMAQRREEWRKVKKNLNEFLAVNRKWHIFHKELFMTGKIDNPDFENLDSYLCGNGGTLLFQMWYYPVADTQVFTRLFEACENPSDIDSARRALEDNIRIDAIKAHPDYGLVGGREELIYRVLYPEYDYDNIKLLSRFKHELHLGPSFQSVVNTIISAHSPLYYNFHVNRYDPGYHIWDYVDYYLNLKKFDGLTLRDVSAGLFINLIYLTRYQAENSKGFAVDNPEAVAVANRLKELFESRPFCANLMEIWDNIDDYYVKYCGPDDYFKLKNG